MMAIDGLEFPFGKTDATYMKYSEQVNPKRQKVESRFYLLPKSGT